MGVFCDLNKWLDTVWSWPDFVDTQTLVREEEVHDGQDETTVCPGVQEIDDRDGASRAEP